MVTADLLLYGGRILTLDPVQPAVEAVATASGQILAIGKEADLHSLVSSRTQTISCVGRTVLPGFIDPHLHLFSWASRFFGVDLSAARSLVEVQIQLARHLPLLSPDAWLRGYGYDEFFLAEKRHPTRHELDVVSTDHPIILRHRTGHAAVLNSSGLRQAKLDRFSVIPAGAIIDRELATGEPTGLLYEAEKYLRAVIPPLSTPEFTTGVQRANEELLRQGVTSFHDAGAGNTLEDFFLFQRLSTNGILKPRAMVMIGTDGFPQVREAQLLPFSGSDRVRLGSIKIMIHEGRGEIYPPPKELRDMVWQAHRQGFQVALHAVEEGAVAAALDAIAQARQRQLRQNHRHRIEHCALYPPPFIEQLRDTGSQVVTQPGFLYFYGEKYAAEVAPELHDWLYRTKSLMAQGIHVAGSSDCPIAPLSPLVGIQAAMTRKTRTGISLNPCDTLTLDEALGLFTRAGAWTGFEEQQKGRIMPGMLADLIVLDGDIATLPAEELAARKVVMTIIAGEIVWSE